MSEEKIKTCQNCRGEPYSLMSIGPVVESDRWLIICHSCGLRMEGDDRDRLIAIWNREASDE